MDNGSERKPSATPNGQERSTSESVVGDRIDIFETKLFFLHPAIPPPAPYTWRVEEVRVGCRQFWRIPIFQAPYSLRHQSPSTPSSCYATTFSCLLSILACFTTRLALFFYNHATSPFLSLSMGRYRFRR
ncbi:hypothetical protein PG997_001318 [Apiospora hydei]|uniref:Uncharacterized protein n=1 Tax=Apiospora hydei TaxID=1337664 RepID=A0ABR1XDJ5_9PEZI